VIDGLYLDHEFGLLRAGFLYMSKEENCSPLLYAVFDVKLYCGFA